GLDGEQDGVSHLLRLPGDAEPVRGVVLDRPALDVRAVERVDEDQEERKPQEQQHQRRPDGEREAGARALHQSASNAPSRRAIRRYTPITISGTIANAAANGVLFEMPMLE